jgi:hypothetical protein
MSHRTRLPGLLRQMPAALAIPGHYAENVTLITLLLLNQALTATYCQNIEWRHVFKLRPIVSSPLLCQWGIR